MNSISINYTLKYELSIAPEYKWTEDKKCFNIKTGRRIKQTLCGGSIGYCIRGKFHSLTSLRPKLRKIEKSDCPF